MHKSVTDITHIARFYANMDEGFVEVFGEVSVPVDEKWWVVSFPKFDTNLTDFAGRASKDELNSFVEALFDASTYLDGITWDEAGYCGQVGRFPVSLSLYNSFICHKWRYSGDTRRYSGDTVSISACFLRFVRVASFAIRVRGRTLIV